MVRKGHKRIWPYGFDHEVASIQDVALRTCRGWSRVRSLLSTDALHRAGASKSCEQTGLFLNKLTGKYSERRHAIQRFCGIGAQER